MIDSNLIKDKEGIRIVVESLRRRGKSEENAWAFVESIISLRKKYISCLRKGEKLRQRRNQLVSNKNLLAKKKKENDANFVSNIEEEIRCIKSDIKKNQVSFNQLKERFNQQVLSIPNLVKSVVPSANEIIVTGNDKNRKKSLVSHLDICEKFKLINKDAAVCLAGSKFAFYQDAGARLLRALSNFMVDEHGKRDYREIIPPLLVNKNALVGTGHLPKFAGDIFNCGDYFSLIPTGEVPLVAGWRNKLFNEKNLPLRLVSYTPCFRLEAGAAGSIDRGLLRVHQFNKVELVQIVKPSESDVVLRSILSSAENIVKELELPYRIVHLSGSELSFSACDGYDVEVWLPSEGRYVEVSSCSNCGDFQSRRLNIKFLENDKNEKYVHTLNGSGVAIDRLIAAIVENNYSPEDEKIFLPKVLYRYFGKKSIKIGEV